MRRLTKPPGFGVPFPRSISGKPSVMRVKLPGINKATKQLANGSYVTYYYAWRGGPKIDAEPGSPDFIRQYNEAHSKRKTPPPGTLFTLICEFRASGEFKACSDSSKRAYTFYLKQIEVEFGDTPIAALSDPRMRGEFKAWRDTMAGKPRTADYAWTTLARVLSVAKDRGRIPVNPCERGGRLYDGSRADLIWSEADLARVLSVASPSMTAAIMLALWTGQRQGDLLRLPWSAYDGKAVRLRQSKTGRSITIPAGKTLRTFLDGMQRVSPIILTNQKGRPWTSDGFRSSWGKLLEKANIDDRTFHDLKGSAVVRLALAEATVPEIATFTGNSLKDVEAILDRHYLGRDVGLAESAVRKMERKEKRTKNANRLQTGLSQGKPRTG